MPSTVTMRDVANAAGVSVATVSLALRNQPNVSAKVRSKIQALVAELGYKTNPYVSALMRTRRASSDAPAGPVIAMVHGLEGPSGWKATSSVTFRQIRRGAMARARDLGYGTEEFDVADKGPTPRRLSDILRARGIRGVLIGPMPDGAAVPALAWEQFSSIRIGPPQAASPMPAVSNDHYFSSVRVLQECHALGYRKPGLLMRASHRERFQGRWEAGFLHAQSSFSGIKPTPPLYVGTLEDEDRFPLEEFRGWLTRHAPDVVVTVAHELAESLLQRCGRVVPRQVGLASLASPELGSRYSGIFQNGELIGATAIEQLIGRMERNETSLPAQGIATMVEGVWNPGATLRRQRR